MAAGIGLGALGGEDSEEVSGVDGHADVLPLSLCACVLVLKTEDAVLLSELEEPTPLSKSPASSTFGSGRRLNGERPFVRVDEVMV